MDFNSLKDQVAGITLYDLKAGVRKVQNGMWQHSAPVQNYSPLVSGHELYGDGGKSPRGNE